MFYIKNNLTGTCKKSNSLDNVVKALFAAIGEKSPKPDAVKMIKANMKANNRVKLGYGNISAVITNGRYYNEDGSLRKAEQAKA